ncbi:SRP40, C-terminal domain-containing protein [Babesia caballi]|uniref:SRP40, C-terminal domain-containing protein n=1 Tax=Babesia caballi TaxID=5871 RepID=A0AAV4LQN2_BABCB|nr:SRP40, C-terminal domain-containing protein [Babesia caballi]
MASHGTLDIVVKILSDLGHSKTLRRLRKETGNNTLRIENVPETVKSFNFNALAAGLTIKEGPAQLDFKAEAEVPHTSEVADHVTADSSKVAPVLKKTQKTAVSSKAEPARDVNVEVPTGRFKRIHDDVWMDRIEKEELKENSYMMKNDEFSLKAAQELIQVKGKNFRTEKMKKKRASWKGSGEITSQINSVTFDDSDAE